MLDELLGRAALKEEIDALEEQIDRLESQFDAERERRRTAVRDRQEADERVNRLEDRIADLEGQLERAREGERAVDFRGTTSLRRVRLREVLDRLDSYRTRGGALTAMVDAIPSEVREAFGERSALVDRAAPCLALADDAGVVTVALEPPLPPEPFVEWDDGFRIEREWFLPTGSFALAVVRSDLFAFGEYEGDERVDFEGFDSDVMGRHSKGGFSQSRFERRRDEQVDVHLDRCREVIAERSPDRLIVVGERTLLGEFEDADATAPVDATGDPEDALDDAFESFWTTTLYQI